ncbi:hypothetical protein SAMN05660666_03906 [Novosphingobium aromaticivorans]|nr:hypothetical protein SAMN05660666_03906 [Novosphingobium aromaticivorans]
MIYPADPPPPGWAHSLRQLALPLLALVLGVAMFVRTVFF